ncbi:hypothetical protein [Actinoplanes derwentensis]|uniref:Uncharacterized protein n=1 Tax=Actinoplanes derwentensis TaxID=113562 RepID=A0A1H2CX40_9ACTN|nr:hypothetical protein [Actinoplanes derwentensis]SDT74847.1 hypothetical protein SAMN04489716_7114 [Actinoplanes derwentensis]
MTEPDVPSVLAGMPTFEWDSDQAVRYEVAVEAISQAVAAYTALVNQARTRGDSAEAERLAGLRADCTQERNALRSTDFAALNATVRRYRDLIESLRAQAR